MKYKSFIYLAATTLLSYSSSANHKFSIGVEGAQYSYKEPKAMSMRGIMPGVNASYIYTFNNGIFLSPEIKGMIGKTNYKGKTIITNEPIKSKKNVPNKFVEGRFLLGKNFSLFSQDVISPYLGVGFRYKEDNMSKDNGYKRASRYLYLPLGVNGVHQFNEIWSLSATAEYDVFLKGWLKSYTKDKVLFETDQDVWMEDSNLKNKQRKGMGIRGEIMVGRMIDSTKFEFGIFANYWDIKQSNKVSLKDEEDQDSGLFWVEPRNKTKEIGIKVKFTI